MYFEYGYLMFRSFCVIFYKLGLCTKEMLSSNTAREKNEVTVILHIMEFCVNEPQYEARVLCSSHNYFCNRLKSFRKCFYKHYHGLACGLNPMNLSSKPQDIEGLEPQQGGQRLE